MATASPSLSDLECIIPLPPVLYGRLGLRSSTTCFIPQKMPHPRPNFSPRPSYRAAPAFSTTSRLIIFSASSIRILGMKSGLGNFSRVLML
ncbi:hypothetical protein LINPERPRIM_LOCUS36257 [Linum perenne]